MRLEVAAPATTANIGPGFDVLGAALGLENTFAIETGRTGFELQGQRPDGPALGRNLFLEAYAAAYDHFGAAPPPIYVHSRAEVPLRSGLGGSASAICAGIVAAGALFGRPLAMDEALALATDLDGHPDNVAACLLGGVTVAAAGSPLLVRRLEPPQLRAVVLYPGSETGTEAARRLLPRECLRSDAVHNIGHTGLIVYAFLTQDYDLLGAACDDRLHEPYRLQALPFAAAARRGALAAGALAVPLSGSGPSLVALVRPAAAKAVHGAFAEVARDLPHAAVLDLPFAAQGARVLDRVSADAS